MFWCLCRVRSLIPSVGDAGSRREGDTAVRRLRTGGAVGNDWCERVDAASGVNAEERGEITSVGIDGSVARGGRGPIPPDGFAARITAVIRLARFLGGERVRAAGGRGESAQGDGVGEIIVRRRLRRLIRDQPERGVDDETRVIAVAIVPAVEEIVPGRSGAVIDRRAVPGGANFPAPKVP